VSESQSDGWTVREDKARRETWLVSPRGHPAHPAVAKRAAERRLGETRTRTVALCGAGQVECDRLVADLEAKDRQAAEQSRQTGQPAMPAERPRSGSRY
jgi:hypothetical protein